jgi:hypothetical protein
MTSVVWYLQQCLLLLIVSCTLKISIHRVNIKTVYTVLIIICLYMHICNRDSPNLVLILLSTSNSNYIYFNSIIRHPFILLWSCDSRLSKLSESQTYNQLWPLYYSYNGLYNIYSFVCVAFVFFQMNIMSFYYAKFEETMIFMDSVATLIMCIWSVWL